jgi:hypothetical protein
MAPPLALLERYLAGLPQGIDSYADCVQKGSVSREFLRFMPSSGLVGRVPKVVEQLIARPPSPSAWVPEVHVEALFLAVLEAHFPNEAEYLTRSYVANKELLTGPLYRVLMLVASPLFLVKNAESRWNAFHRGVSMVTDSLPTEKTGTGLFHLAYPKLLLPEVLAKGYTTAFKAALEAAGGREVKAEVVKWGETRCDFSISWR